RSTKLQKSSLDSRRSRVAFRAMAGLFAATTVFVLVLFVRALDLHHDIRTGLFTYAIFTGAATIGLWRVQRWGRSVALVIALGNAGLGALATLSWLVSRRGQLVGPLVLLVTSSLLAYL